MRFIASVASYGMQIRPERTMVLATGETQQLQAPIYVKFNKGDVTAHEVEEAKARFSLRGFKQERDEVTEVSPINRLSSFDTEQAAIDNGWDEATKALVEDELMKRAKDGVDVIYVEPTPVLAPWPLYDEFTGTSEELLAKLLGDGISVSDTLRYERNNAKRPEILTMLEQEMEKQDADLAEREFIGA